MQFDESILSKVDKKIQAMIEQNRDYRPNNSLK
jgi:hypothetical protein